MRCWDTLAWADGKDCHMYWPAPLLLVAAVELAHRQGTLALASVRDHWQLRQILNAIRFPTRLP
jgi:hypothetical protein